MGNIIGGVSLEKKFRNFLWCMLSFECQAWDVKLDVCVWNSVETVSQEEDINMKVVSKELLFQAMRLREFITLKVR